MRKLFRFLIRLIFISTILVFLYLSKKVYDIEDLGKGHFDDVGLPRDALNDNDVNLMHKTKDSLDFNDHVNDDKGKIEIGENIDVNGDGENGENGENKFDELPEDEHDDIEDKKAAPHNDMNDINNNEKHNRWDNFKKEGDLQKPLKLPPFVQESPFYGPGEHGNPVEMRLNTEEEKESKRLFKLNDFNQYVSDRISIHRRLDDNRKQGCKDMRYPDNLPKVSVIICFHNEAWTVLLRSVHSILDRSPPNMLREIILVDDFSTMDHLKESLDWYMKILPKVKIVRATKREGLIRGRLLGYNIAKGPVLVFLDSHIECFPGWLEPLVFRIHEDPKVVPFPNIPSINRNTFATTNRHSLAVGVFRWDGLTFIWGPMSLEEKKRRKTDIDPIRSPTMPGGLFAIDREWFTTLGTYDQGLDYWGGENIELSFKAWMCNGSIEVAPCSHVGHIYRQTNPIKWPTGGVTMRNSIRVAEVWMDDYKEVFYDYSYPPSDFGDVSDRKALRQSLHCHNFKWYVENVLENKVPPIVVATGEIRSESMPYCLDSMGDRADPQLYPCHGTGMNQRWVYTVGNNLLQGLKKKLCYENDRLKLHQCQDSSTLWKLNYESGTIQHVRSGLCLEKQIPTKLAMGKCNGSKNQRWNLPKRKTV